MMYQESLYPKYTPKRLLKINESGNTYILTTSQLTTSKCHSRKIT